MTPPAPSRGDSSNSPTPISIGFYSLGCAKNLVDSQLMAGNLLSEGLVLAPFPEEADVVIVNTCSFIEDAREESRDSIREACALKEEGHCRAVIVTGCMPQRYRGSLGEQFPGVDAFIGLDELDDIATVARNVLQSPDVPITRISAEPVRIFEPAVPQLALTGGPYAYLKIAEGCNHTCAFCAIPGIRGRHRSRSVENIVSEAEKLLEAGLRELVLISQDVTFYGRDRDNEGRLPELIRALGAIGGDFWIRLLYGYPTYVTDSLLATMAEVPQVCHYLDVPIQHAHADMLKRMRRADTFEPVETLAQRARAAMPDVTLRTTCLLGHPGEEEHHFEYLLDFVREARFDHLGCFIFSPEVDTPAETMPDRPPEAIAAQRRERLMLAQQEIVHRKAAGLVGQRATCLLESPHPDHPDVWIGRTARHAPEVDGCVYVENAQSAKRGDFCSVHYTESDGYDMIAQFDTGSSPREKRKAS